MKFLSTAGLIKRLKLIILHESFNLLIKPAADNNFIDQD
jgi:hypothetical protein